MKNGWSWKKLGDGSLDNMSTSSGCGGRRHSEIVGYALNETQATAQDPEAPFSNQLLVLRTAPVAHVMVVLRQENRNGWLS